MCALHRYFRDTALAVGLVFALAGQIRGADLAIPEAKPMIAPPAKWVVPHFFARLSEDQVQPGEDERMLLWERQFNAGENENFTHVVRQILSFSGVQNGATITVDFDPSYQSLTFHWLRIWRDNGHLERLDADKIKLIQPERDLDQAQFNGKKSAVMVLDDVRVGDVVDCAWSIRGGNPVFGGRFSGVVPVQFGQPVERLTTRVLWPRARHLRARTFGCAVQPALVSTKEFMEYTWDLTRVPGLRPEDSLPDWYDPEPWVQLSEFQTWAEVGQWASALFQNTAPPSAELLRKTTEWRQLGSPEQQVLAALRFLQDEVRYFGTEIGVNSHRPADPSLVFSRRYGDCKDKALLFVTLLRGLGIEAYPVLVNSDLCGTIDQWLPSATAFDHVIVQVLCDGQTYWLDPTAGYQRGSLAAHYLPCYGCGLVVSPQTTGLSVIPQSTGLPATTTTEYFRLRGKNEPADLKVVTVAEGRDADNVRAYFATTPRDTVTKSYLKFYADAYPGLTSAAPIVIADDEQQNRIETTEMYTLSRGWVAAGKSEKYKCDFYPCNIAGLFKTPTDTDRQMPLGIRFPEHQIVRTEVTLPSAWPTEAQDKTISDAAFFFHKNCQVYGNKVVMAYEYRSFAYFVPAGRAAEYLQHVAEATKRLGYTVSWRSSDEEWKR